MADNTELNAGTGGDVIATDDLAGVKHQLVKVEFGGDGGGSDDFETPFRDANYRHRFGGMWVLLLVWVLT